MARTPQENTTATPPAPESKGDKFIRLAETRVGKALTAIAQCETLANKSNYDFDADQCGLIDDALCAAVVRVKEAFAAALAGKAAKKQTGFTLVKAQAAPEEDKKGSE